MCATHDNAAVARVLLERGGRPSLRLRLKQLGYTPLHCAAGAGSAAVAALLVRSGASVHATAGRLSRTALDAARIQGHASLANDLREEWQRLREEGETEIVRDLRGQVGERRRVASAAKARLQAERREARREQRARREAAREGRAAAVREGEERAVEAARATARTRVLSRARDRDAREERRKAEDEALVREVLRAGRDKTDGEKEDGEQKGHGDRDRPWRAVRGHAAGAAAVPVGREAVPSRSVTVLMAERGEVGAALAKYKIAASKK